MSVAAAHESKIVRQSCQSCRDRKARFQYRGEVRADRDHTLCFECYRSELNRQRAERLAAEDIAFMRPAFEVKSPFDVAHLSERQVTHRQRMLSHLRRVAAV